MKFLKLYIKHFWFINNVLYLIIKYNLIIIIFSKKQLLNYIRFENTKTVKYNHSETDLRLTNKRINKVFYCLPFKKKCLILSLVKRKILKDFDIVLGVRYDNKILNAHSWLNNEEENNEIKFTKLINV